MGAWSSTLEGLSIFTAKKLLRECIEWLSADAAPGARQAGLVTAAIAISARYRRVGRYWDPHLECTRAFLATEAAACAQRRTAVMLGAGACLDVPLKTLAATFDRVILVDAVFLRRTRRWVRQFPNVECLTYDLTESLGLLNKPEQPDLFAQLAAVRPRLLLDDAQVDFAASVNLVSQLPLLPMRRLLASGRYASPAVNQLGLQLMAGHVRYLNAFTGRKAIVFDAEMWRLSPEGERREVVDLRPVLQLPHPPEQHWFWEVAPASELRSGKLMHRVEAVAW